MGGGTTTPPYGHPPTDHQHLHCMRTRPPSMVKSPLPGPGHESRTQVVCVEQPRQDEKDKIESLVKIEPDPVKDVTKMKEKEDAVPPATLILDRPPLEKRRQSKAMLEGQQQLVQQIKKKRESPNDGITRVQCRHCREWYKEEQMWQDSCEFAPDSALACINAATCILCAECMLYHFMADSEGEFVKNPCSCDRNIAIDRGVHGRNADGRKLCRQRWLGLFILSLLVPCLCCYLPLRSIHTRSVACGLCGGRHEPV